MGWDLQSVLHNILYILYILYLYRICDVKHRKVIANLLKNLKFQYKSYMQNYVFLPQYLN